MGIDWQKELRMEGFGMGSLGWEVWDQKDWVVFDGGVLDKKGWEGQDKGVWGV